ncbi:hypothetical protein GCM10010411_55570 [Actinomadura fulvescens]|uniref:Acyl carrier protein n=1 Tax=Actinomadura fulvescens TaxID=46160 RepID=A0ABP6CGR7_9ACTN
MGSPRRTECVRLDVRNHCTSGWISGLSPQSRTAAGPATPIIRTHPTAMPATLTRLTSDLATALGLDLDEVKDMDLDLGVNLL